MNIYGDKDPRSIPVYAPAEAAHHVHVPLPTVRSWVGRDRGGGTPRPLIVVEPDTGGAYLLSFNILIELHVLGGVRRVHRLNLDAVRRSVACLAERLHSQHPLASHDFLTDGVSLFVATNTASRAGCSRSRGPFRTPRSTISSRAWW